MRPKDELGRRGEGIAAEFLVSSGMQVLERNWRCGLGEVDIVARDGPEFVIVEVKTRSSRAYGHPFEAITPDKLRRLHHLAAAWAAEHVVGAARRPRVDVVGIVYPRYGEPCVEHLRAVH